MTNANSVRKSAVAVFALGVVLFSLTGLDSTLRANAFAATGTTQTTAQA